MEATPSKKIEGKSVSPPHLSNSVSPPPSSKSDVDSENVPYETTGAKTNENEEDFEQIYKNIEAIMNNLRKTENFGAGDLHSSLTELVKVYYMYSRGNMENLYKICSLMLETGFLDFFVRMWDKFHEDTTSFYGDDHSEAFNNMNKMKVILWNYSDKCEELARACHKDGKAIDKLMKEFTIPELGVDRLSQPRIRHMMKTNLGILHNVVRLDNKNREHIRKDNGVEKILEFSKSRYLIIKAKIFIVLAYCINEDENKKLMIGTDVIEFILKILSSAVSEPDHIAKPYAFSAAKTIAALSKLASNDENKKRLVDSKVLPLLTGLLDVQKASEEENLESVNCIWSLAFHPENQAKIINEPGLIDRVKSLRARAEAGPRLRRACTSLLFVLHLEEPPEEITTERKTNTKHIMISYNWEVQTIMLKIRDFLKKEGYDVWMDVEQMQDSILSAMADAVENAALIIVAMTESYKNSNSCRTEAEYSYKREVPILPLLLQSGYIADGWLGAMVGTKLYVDISSDSVENKYDDIRTQIKKLMPTILNVEPSVVPAESTVVAKNTFPVASQPVAFTKMTSVDGGGGIALAKADIQCKEWSTNQVQTWVKNIGIRENAVLSGCDGIALAQICKLFLRSPDAYYSILRKDVNLDFRDSLLFTNAIEALLFN